MTFGMSEDCDFCGTNVELGKKGMTFDCTHNGETVSVVMDTLWKT